MTRTFFLKHPIVLILSEVAIIVFFSVPQQIFAQFRNHLHQPITFADSVPSVPQDNIYEAPPWLVAAACFDIATPKVGSFPIPLFFSGKLGVANKGILYSLAYHPANGSLLADASDTYYDDYRHDLALLVGIMHSKEPILWSASGGLCFVDYSFRGDMLTDGRNGTSVTYAHRTGTTVGIAASANYMYLPVENVGIGGVGIYASLTTGASYIALEFSLVQINLPM